MRLCRASRASCRQSGPLRVSDDGNYRNTRAERTDRRHAIASATLAEGDRRRRRRERAADRARDRQGHDRDPGAGRAACSRKSSSRSRTRSRRASCSGASRQALSRSLLPSQPQCRQPRMRLRSTMRPPRHLRHMPPRCPAVATVRRCDACCRSTRCTRPRSAEAARAAASRSTMCWSTSRRNSNRRRRPRASSPPLRSQLGPVDACRTPRYASASQSEWSRACCIPLRTLRRSSKSI